MSQPPQYPGPSGQNGAPGPGRNGASGYPGAPGYNGAAQSPYGSTPATPAAPPAKKRWPLFAAIGGCGCLLLIALLIGVIAFGNALGGSGSDDPTTAPVTTTDAPTTDAPTTAPATSEAPSSEAPSSDAAPGAITETDQQSAKESTVGYLHGLLDKDAAASCTFVLDPANSGPLTDQSAFWSSCLDAMNESMTDIPADDDGTIRSMITPDSFTATERPDGKLDVYSEIFGADNVFILAKASDGNWYIDSIAMASEV